MLFHRVDFLLFFAVVFALYLRLPLRAQNHWLLLASYVFYSAWDWRFSGLMLLSTLIDFASGWAIAAGRHRRAWLVASVLSNLGLLGLFKYGGFFLDSLGRLLALLGLHASLPVLRVVLPMGISFYTFQSLSYTIDVYRSHTVARRPERLGPRRRDALRATWDAFVDFALYVSLFPQLVAGPIERSSHLLGQVMSPRRVTLHGLRDGAWLFVLGLVMKVAIADPIAYQVDQVYANPSAYDLLSLYVATVGFAIQIYCDFGGYSNMARGLASMMGFELMVNFRQPYLAASFADFWRRWHISFSTWIRDYLYIPMGGSRLSPLRTYANLLASMVLSGLWHGATWAFAAWGALHGALLALERVAGLDRRRPRSALLRFGYGVLVFHGVLAGWFLFRVGDLGAVGAHVLRLAAAAPGQLATALPVDVGALLPFANFALLHALYDLPCWRVDRVLLARDFAAPWRLALYTLAALMLLSAGGQSDAAFIYFQF